MNYILFGFKLRDLTDRKPRGKMYCEEVIIIVFVWDKMLRVF